MTTSEPMRVLLIDDEPHLESAVQEHVRAAVHAVAWFYQLEWESKVVRLDGRPVELSAREWAVIEVLGRRRQSTVSKEQIEDALYAFGEEIESNTIEVYVSRIRRKLGRNFIRTIRGLGYRLGD